MSDRNFSRRRRGGMRFRPTGGLGHVQQQRPDRDALQARAEVVGDQAPQDKVYERRHAKEIDQAENIAAGLPPEGVPQEPQEVTENAKRGFREPNLQTPAQVQEEKVFAPVPVPEQPKGLMESIKAVANTLVKKVQRLIKPVKQA